MIAQAELDRLLQADESDILERKASLADEKSIRFAMLAFANDIANRGGGKIIIGQMPDKTIVGLKADADSASQKITHIARTGCHPAIHVVIDICHVQGENVAIVDVQASIAKPHFRGECYVRQGSTNRIATDAEIVMLRASSVDPKLRQLLEWQQSGKTRVTCRQAQEVARTTIYTTVYGKIFEIKETYIVLEYDLTPIFRLAVPLNELTLGYDYERNQPLLGFPRHVN
jgi:hypothetical protein